MAMTQADHKRAFLAQWIKDYCKDNFISLSVAKSEVERLIKEEAEREAMSAPEKLAYLQALIDTEHQHKPNPYGQRVFAIKRAREVFGFGLREAMDFTDSHIKNGTLKVYG